MNMPIVGFNLTKINVQREGVVKANIKVNNNIQIKDIKETKLRLGTDKQKTLDISFVYTTKYDPKIGNIELEGDVLLLEEAKKAKQIEKEWKKNKKIPADYVEPVMNSILNRCTVEAILLSREVNLPTPVPLPKVQPKRQAEDYVG